MGQTNPGVAQNCKSGGKNWRKYGKIYQIYTNIQIRVKFSLTKSQVYPIDHLLFWHIKGKNKCFFHKFYKFGQIRGLSEKLLKIG